MNTEGAGTRLGDWGQATESLQGELGDPEKPRQALQELAGLSVLLQPSLLWLPAVRLTSLLLLFLCPLSFLPA